MSFTQFDMNYDKPTKEKNKKKWDVVLGAICSYHQAYLIMIWSKFSLLWCSENAEKFRTPRIYLKISFFDDVREWFGSTNTRVKIQDVHVVILVGPNQSCVCVWVVFNEDNAILIWTFCFYIILKLDLYEVMEETCLPETIINSNEKKDIFIQYI